MKSVLDIQCGECRSHLAAFIQGDVSPLLRRRIARHIDHCPACYNVYLQELDLMRDLKRSVPLIGNGHQPSFDAIWSEIQSEIVKPKPGLPRFHMRYGLAMLALVMVFLVPLSMGNQHLTLASPPTQPSPLVQRATPNSTEPGAAETPVSVSFLTDESLVTPEAPQRTAGPSLDVISTP
ncbi:MAG: zf-HC2 domain-containing protein [Anaerolineae bacterium]|nr:zf-HC2 domain-containing protein [Anaerolineae bacterium]